jgi:phytol kinase
MPSASDLLAGAIVTVLFLSVVAAAEAWRRWGNPEPEWTRKLIHIGGGLVALSLPFVIESHLVVFAMALGMAALFLAGKLTGRLQSLHGVDRKSSGTEYHPVSVYLLFFFTQGTPWKYFICLLVLTTADALAALIGSRYGRLRYEVDDNYKSVEGSLVFLVVTFLAVIVPLLMWPMVDRPPVAVCLLTALLVAMLTTGFEAIAQHGRDNLWVPMGALIVLNRTLPLSVNELTQRVAVLVGIFLVATLATWKTATFNVGGTLVLILVAYSCWTLTSIDWALPVFWGFAFYVSVAIICRSEVLIASKPVVRALLLPFAVMASGFFLQLNDVASGYQFLYGSFLVGCVTVTAQAAWAQVLSEWPMSGVRRITGSIVTTCLACTAIVVPAFCLQSRVSIEAPLWVAVTALTVVIPRGSWFDFKRLDNSLHWWWIARILSTVVAMGLMALIQALGVSPLWNPR